MKQSGRTRLAAAVVIIAWPLVTASIAGAAPHASKAERHALDAPIFKSSKRNATSSRDPNALAPMLARHMED